jgi:transposase
MPVYGPQLKEQIVKNAMQAHNQSVAQISRDTGMTVPVLSRLKKQVKSGFFGRFCLYG